MAHHTFFSFHYERDAWRAALVRNSSQLKENITAEWIDALVWEQEKKKNEAALRRLIDNALVGTSVTAVLIGAETANRRWVNYEVDQSITRGNGLLGIYLNNIKDDDGKVTWKGNNPLPSDYRTYDWVNDNGNANLGRWIDAAHGI